MNVREAAPGHLRGGTSARKAGGDAPLPAASSNGGAETTAGARSLPPHLAPARGIALQPVFEIGDRSSVGYEVLLRPGDRPPEPLADFESALALVPMVNPAVLILPADESLFSELGDDLPSKAGAAGVMPAELVWLFGGDGRPGFSDSKTASGVASMGFGLAVDNVGVGALADAEMADLEPAFAFLEAGLADRVLMSPRARAEVAALMSYFGRLGTKVIARGVDDERIAQLWLELGLQLGVGRQLHPPVVLDRAAAAQGDVVVTGAWFRERAVRVLGRHDAEKTEVSYSLLPEPSEAVDDRGFARVLAGAARALQAEHDPRRILEVVAELVPRVLPVDRLAIFQADWDRYTLKAVVIVGDDLEGLTALDDLMDSGITGWAFQLGEPYNCGDTFGHAKAAHVPGSSGGRYDESLLVIPLVAGDQRLGALDVWRDGLDRFSEADVERCALIGYLASAAWRNAQLYGELEQRVVTDKLTGLLNKRWWDELAPREAAQALRLGSDLALLLVDLDHFKRVNDTCGHAVGDVTLRNAARVLASAVRSGDAAVRFGGDEFLLVLHGADARGAQRVAESVRKDLASLPATCEGLGSITASIGVALFPTHGSSLEEVVHEADLAMYRAKARGRDRVVLFSPE